jgi:hypothetical protein
MLKLRATVSWAVLSWAITFASPASAQPSPLPLELLNISGIGVNNMSANNRIFHAYPGLPYNIRAAVIGGTYPYSFSLLNAPAGMTIDPFSGEVNWPNPTANATPTIVITDSAPSPVTINQAWTINVATTRFKFLDPVNGVNASNNGCASNCGLGTIDRPWRDLNDLRLNDVITDITYFRGGVFHVNVIPDSARQSLNTTWERVIFSDDNASSAAGSVMWLAYPGETPVLDFTCIVGTGPGQCAPSTPELPGRPASLLIRHNGGTVYIDGLETRDSDIIAFQFEATGGARRGGTYRRLNMHDHGPGADGSNASFIMSESAYPNVAYGMVIQDSMFANVTSVDPDDAVVLKMYSLNKILIEDNVVTNAVTAIELKADIRNFTVRRNTLTNITGTALGGNMHGCVNCAAPNDLHTTGGEFLFNSVRTSGAEATFALRVNQDGQALAVDVRRNTFFGRILIGFGDVAGDPMTADGPFTFSRNVIVNSDSGTPAGSHIIHNGTAQAGEFVLSPSPAHNLVGTVANNIVDSNNNLTAAFQSEIGQRGHQQSTMPWKVTGLRMTTP